jgi:O-antigen/teichoic acid export membrane protein
VRPGPPFSTNATHQHKNTMQAMSSKTRISKENLAATVGRNTVFGVLARVAQVATRLVTIPIVIAHLGLGGYGIWSIVMTTAAYMRFGSVGIKSAFQKYVAEATGTGDFDTTNKLLSTGCFAMLVLSVLGVIPLAFFSTGLAKTSGVPTEFLHSAAGSISVLAVIIVFSNVGSVYEAIVMGGHRIDLARNLTTFFTVAEAIAIVTVLHFGYGLIAMAAVMASSEAGFVLCCYVASKKVVPQIRVSRAFVTRNVAGELVRFAGSYQLVSVLELLYLAIVPVTVLRQFGAEASGIFALATRLASAVLMLPEAFLLPILSGGAMVYGSGHPEHMRLLIIKAFKATLGLGLFPLAFLSVFGTTMVFAWTGQANSSFRVVLWLVCAAGLFQSFSTLGLVLYRVSGRALLDNIKQVLRIVVLLSIAVLARQLGFYGILGGLAGAEFVGMLFMAFAIAKTFHSFRVRSLMPDALKVAAATAFILTAALATDRFVPSPLIASDRLSAMFRLAKVGAACLLAALPAFVLTGSVTRTEGRALMSAFLPRGLRACQPSPERVG